MIGAVRRWAGELVRRRELLYILTWREVRIKYKQSVMGLLWAILMPIVIVGAGLTVRYVFASVQGTPLAKDDLVLVTVKSVPWAFFVSAIRFASYSLITNSTLVTKVYMPREMFPIASVLSQLVDFGVASVVVVIVVGLLGTTPHATLFWVPPLLALLILFTTGLSLFLAAAALFFRDVKYIVEVILTFAIFFTPVFYETNMFRGWARLILLNPVAPILEGLGAAVTGHAMPGGGWLVYSAATSIIGCVVAMLVFKRLEPYFAESV